MYIIVLACLVNFVFTLLIHVVLSISEFIYNYIYVCI